MKSSRALFNCNGSEELPRVSRILRTLLGEEDYEKLLCETCLEFGNKELLVNETYQKMMEEYNEIWNKIFLADPELARSLDCLKGNLNYLQDIFFFKKGFELGQKQSQMLDQILFCK